MVLNDILSVILVFIRLMNKFCFFWFVSLSMVMIESVKILVVFILVIIFLVMNMVKELVKVYMKLFLVSKIVIGGIRVWGWKMLVR